MAVPTNTRFVPYASHVKLFAHTQIQAMLLELLSLTDVDNSTALLSVEIPTRCSFVIEFIIPKFIEGSTCFERHTAYHQEL